MQRPGLSSQMFIRFDYSSFATVGLRSPSQWMCIFLLGHGRSAEGLVYRSVNTNITVIGAHSAHFHWFGRGMYLLARTRRGRGR